MSSPVEIQYVYIPNLVGRQMLRVPVLPCDELDKTSTNITSTPLKVNTSTFVSRPSYTRESSPTVSIESVSDEE
ncbi:hypothetical protein BDV96DRAFT_563668 [Lophiotrema nucula]|uniref:Uncharacterized protein n=1 Tax=Lophiotrema nucula TaxID=690887 RepID=A0A6A5ZN97_9PLEO|nr:hypothetical protein BDV96DRAFT_563668 [Lophiotrema nucula]